MTCASSTDGIPAGFQDLQNVCEHGNTTTTNVDLNGASPTLSLGDGTGTSTITLDKADALTADIGFYNVGVLRWRIRFLTDETLRFSRYDATGAFVDNTIVQQLNGRWDYPASSTWPSASPVIELGDGTGSPAYRLRQSADEAGAFEVQNVAARIGSFIFGLGAPTSAPGTNDIFYFRFDGGAGTSIYKRIGGAWVAIA